MALITPENLAFSYQMISEVIDIIETNWTPVNLFPKGEPQLGRRGLYASLGGDKSAVQTSMAFLWVLNLADGNYSLLDMSLRSRLPYADIFRAAQLLLEKGLLGGELPQA